MYLRQWTKQKAKNIAQAYILKQSKFRTKTKQNKKKTTTTKRTVTKIICTCALATLTAKICKATEIFWKLLTLINLNRLWCSHARTHSHIIDTHEHKSIRNAHAHAHESYWLYVYANYHVFERNQNKAST